VVETGLASFGAGLMSWKTVGCRRVICARGVCLDHEKPAMEGPPAAVLHRRANTSRMLGVFRWMS